MKVAVNLTFEVTHEARLGLSMLAGQGRNLHPGKEIKTDLVEVAQQEIEDYLTNAERCYARAEISRLQSIASAVAAADVDPEPPGSEWDAGLDATVPEILMDEAHDDAP